LIYLTLFSTDHQSTGWTHCLNCIFV
jgi:hypothetical protein